ncbi:competence protein CoiA [Cytophaga hutchinsonii]|uniref:Competence protein transcription factor n=1 Tax=Cytophaga hutchinsonii (strain ATCC 33406 / DSM 1761 / CIP 103989 / NBRC 15051 / NCIMB 9469 / D465) TaxID=269798 RepID=A0A6N4SM55_CYTH3|nr:hypothetical protein [Cytophaga hutchinsonii]ABG57330.1 competence protein; transcription factor [Cytophaga hutchinsonii ATCC 33406]SFX46502.1 competence protein CoiA [Cytophaga hutchinsonii ATCC 33406]
MIHAKNVQGQKIKVSFSGEKAKCIDCGQDVRGHKGRMKIPYWQHLNKKDCDAWFEPITRWHIDWQNKFPKEFQEVSLIDPNTKEFHRADVRTNSGLVIEVQHSPIKPDEIEQRENFYGKNKLLWILNGESLLKHCRLNYRYEKKEMSLSFEIPHYLDKSPEFNFQAFNEYFLKSQALNKIRIHPDLLDFENQNGNYFLFHFNNSVSFESIKYELIYDARKILNILLNEKFHEDYLNEFKINYTDIPQDRFRNINLIKKYWRPFIDLMKHPVFIDNLEGIETDKIYFYQKNEIIDKDEFIKNIEKSWLAGYNKKHLL